MRKCVLLPLFKILNSFLSAHFSENLGYLFLSPLVGGNLFSLLFGRNLDAHRSPTPPTTPPPPHDTSLALLDHRSPPSPPPPVQVYDSTPQCLLGINCYRDTLYLTMFATFLAILLSIWAGYRDRQKITMLRKTKLNVNEVI